MSAPVKQRPAAAVNGRPVAHAATVLKIVPVGCSPGGRRRRAAGDRARPGAAPPGGFVLPLAIAPIAPARRWRPLLRGAAAAEVLTVVHEIADALRDPDRLPPAHGSVGARALAASVGGDASLASGHAGLALLFTQLHRTTRAPRDRDAAIDHLNHALALAEDLPSLGFFSGLPGVAFAATQVHRRFGGGAEDPVAAVDDVLVARTEAGWTGVYDLVGGLVGVGVCCLERMPAPGAARALAAVVRGLEAAAEWQGDAATWLTPPAGLPPHQRKAAPDGYHNLGAAHGMPAVVALLAAAAACGVATPGTPGLAAAGVRWLLAQRRDGGQGDEVGDFPSWIPVGARPAPPSRLAWCYGDAGIVAMLDAAARAAGRDDWAAAALATARRAAARPEAACGVRDAGLCHGAAGLAHLFQLLHRSTGDAALATAARAWTRRTLALRRRDVGVAGFPSLAADGDGGLTWQADRGLLGGAAGVALALLATVSAAEPHWNRCLVVAPPPMPEGAA